MLFWFASVDRWISHATVVGVHVDFQTDATLLPLFVASDHVRPELQVLLGSILSIGRFLPLIPLSLHLFRFRVVAVGNAFLDQLLAVVHQDVEMIGRMRESIVRDAQHFQIFENNLDERREGNGRSESADGPTFSYSAFSLAGLVSSKRMIKVPL